MTEIINIIEWALVTCSYSGCKKKFAIKKLDKYGFRWFCSEECVKKDTEELVKKINESEDKK